MDSLPLPLPCNNAAAKCVPASQADAMNSSRDVHALSATKLRIDAAAEYRSAAIDARQSMLAIRGLIRGWSKNDEDW